MRMVVAWVEPTLEPHHCATWPLEAPTGVGLVLGAQAAPAALAWLRRTGADGVVVAGRPASRRTTRYVANVLSGADPSLLLVTRDVRAGAVAALSTGIVVDGAGLGEASGWLAAFDRELAESWAGVWLRSVTAVPAPNPSVGQYLRSFFPGGPRFLVLQSPRPAILRGASPMPDAPTRGGLLVGVAEGQEVPAGLSGAFPGLEVVSLPAPVPARRVFGATGCEFVINAGELWRPHAAPERCRICGQGWYLEACPFCHAVAARSVLG